MDRDLFLLFLKKTFSLSVKIWEFFCFIGEFSISIFKQVCYNKKKAKKTRRHLWVIF